MIMSRKILPSPREAKRKSPDLHSGRSVLQSGPDTSYERGNIPPFCIIAGEGSQIARVRARYSATSFPFFVLISQHGNYMQAP